MRPSKNARAGGRAGEYSGVRDLELAERQLVDVPGAQIRRGEGGWQAVEPAPEEAGHRAGTQPVTQPLQQRRVLAAAEPVVQGGIPDPALGQLLLGRFMAVEPDPDRIWGVGVGLPERPAPLGVP
jgi:hypothetical protein